MHMLFMIGQVIGAMLTVTYVGLLLMELVRRHREGKHRIPLMTGLFMIPQMVLTLMSVMFGSELMPLASFFIIFGSGVLLLTYLYDFIKDRYQQNWTDLIYFAGICFTAATTSMIGTGLFAYGTDFGEVLLGVFLIAGLIIFCTIPFWFCAFAIKTLSNRKVKSNQAINRHIKADKLQYYRDHGLNEQEIIFFRQQMGQAKERIINIEKSMDQVAKLRVIEARHNTVDVSKQFFKAIVNEPERLAQAGLFLNRLLPSLEDLSAKYNEVSQHVAKNKQTYMILERSAATIDKVCESITEQYLAYHQDLYNDLDDEIKLANKSMNQSMKDSDQDGDLVDELVNDPFNFDEEA